MLQVVGKGIQGSPSGERENFKFRVLDESVFRFTLKPLIEGLMGYAQ
jgi:hypothetical protein